MGIDTIRTRRSGENSTIDGVVDVSEIDAAAVVEMAADLNVYLERRGSKTYLVTA